MIIETEDHRNLLRLELETFEYAKQLAQMNKRFNLKTGVVVVQGLQTKSQIICGCFASFRVSTYSKESSFHPEYTVLDMYSAELDNLTLYIARLNLQNELLPSRPCTSCLKAIQSCPEVVSLVYADENSRIVKEVR